MIEKTTSVSPARRGPAAAAHRRQIEGWAIAAHELRNPLTPILTTAFLLTKVAAEELPHMQALIERQVALMSRLIDDLVDVSRMNTGKLRVEFANVAIVDVVAAAADACRPAMIARHHDFLIDLPPCALEMHGDAGRLIQVVGNLLENASMYTPDGGEIRLSVTAVPGGIEMAVVDNGIGIAADALPGVFELFVRGSHAAETDGRGMGIGLAVVRELVDAHGGTVVASSDGVGLGSRFVVSLPLRKDADGEAPNLREIARA